MHIAKVKANQVFGLLAHDERVCENHTNEKIDPSKSHLNYNLVDGVSIDNYKGRMNEVYMRKSKTANTLAMLSTTLPKDVPDDRKEEFFKNVYEFYCSKFGKKNVISSIVHLDETTPHMHTKVIPVYFNEKKQMDTVSFDKVFNRTVYRTIHKDLQEYLEKEMGIPVSILNGATKDGNKSIDTLKRKTAKDLVEEAEKEATKNCENMVKEAVQTSNFYEAQYNAKKIYIDEITKQLELSMMYPKYAKVHKNIFGKEFVTVPREKWEEKHISVNQVNYAQMALKEFDKNVSEFRDKYLWVDEVLEENEQLKVDNEKLSNTIERVNHTLQSLPAPARTLFFKAYNNSLEQEEDLEVYLYGNSKDKGRSI